MILAGRHSIGTHAACVVATRQELIVALQSMLKKTGISLRETQQPFWAVVRGTLSHDGSFSDDVEIVKVGGYTRTDRGGRH